MIRRTFLGTVAAAIAGAAMGVPYKLLRAVENDIIAHGACRLPNGDLLIAIPFKDLRFTTETIIDERSLPYLSMFAGTRSMSGKTTISNMQKEVVKLMEDSQPFRYVSEWTDDSFCYGQAYICSAEAGSNSIVRIEFEGVGPVIILNKEQVEHVVRYGIFIPAV